MSDADSWSQQLSELSATAEPLSHAIDCSSGEYEFIYLNTPGINTLKILRERLREKSAFQVFNILALFPVKNGKWEILMRRSYRHKFVGLVNNGFTKEGYSILHRQDREILLSEGFVARAALAQILATNGDSFKLQALSVYVKFIKLYGWQHLFLDLVLGLLSPYYPISYPDFSCIFGHCLAKAEITGRSKAENRPYALCDNHDGELPSEEDIDEDTREEGPAWKRWMRTRGKRCCAKIALVVGKMFCICTSRC